VLVDGAAAAGAVRAGAGALAGAGAAVGAGCVTDGSGADGSCGAGRDGAGSEGAGGSCGAGSEGAGGSCGAGSEGTTGSWACAGVMITIASTTAMPGPVLRMVSSTTTGTTDNPCGKRAHRRPRTLTPMADWDDVDRLARELPGVDEGTSHGNRAWTVRGKGFAWERPLRRSDLEALGDTAPEGPILGVRVEHLVAKEALLADDPGVYFTTPHFDGYPAVLVRLAEIETGELEELLAEAWLCRAPKRLAREFLEARGGS